MKELNQYTKRASHFIRAYWDSESQLLSEVYTSYSRAKAQAWKYCMSLCNAECGYRFRIISYNSMQFTVGWIINGGDLRVKTRNSSYIIKNIVLPF